MGKRAADRLKLLARLLDYAYYVCIIAAPTNEALRQRDQNCIRAKKGELTADFEFPGMKRNRQICRLLRPLLSLDRAIFLLRL